MPWGVAAAAVVGAVASNVASNKASGDIKRSTDQSIAATQDAAAQARLDVNRLFPEARQSADLGFQGALDVFGQSVPSQANVFQQGNVGAQQQILAGLPQMQNAILGGNVDLSGLQPVNLQADLGFVNQQLPSIPEAELLVSPLGGFKVDESDNFRAVQNNRAIGGSLGGIFGGSSGGFSSPLAGIRNFKELSLK